MQPEIKQVQRPDEESILNKQLGDFDPEFYGTDTGLFTDEEFKSWETNLFEASFQRELGEEVSYGLCNSNEGCTNSHERNNPIRYDPALLIPEQSCIS